MGDRALLCHLRDERRSFASSESAELSEGASRAHYILYVGGRALLCKVNKLINIKF